MPAPKTHLWAEYAVELYMLGMSPSRPGNKPVASGMRIMGTHRLVETLALEFGDGIVPWTAAVARRALALARPGPRGPDGISFMPDGFDALHQVAAVRMGLAMAIGDLAPLSPAERAMVAACARTMQARDGTVPNAAEALRRMSECTGTSPPAISRVDMVVPPTFGFGFAWARTSGNTTSATAGRGHARMVRMHPAEAPVACRLGTPRMAALDVRMDAGGFLRPVTTPGTWDPIDVATFLEATWTGARWADNPFMPARRDLPLLTLAETALPGRDGVPSRQAAAALVSSVGTLVAIDGIVHRRCPPPEACVTRDRRQGPARVTWRIPGQVEATDDMGCLRLDQHRVLRLAPLDAMTAPFHPGTEHAPFATLPLTDADALAKIASGALNEEVRPAGTESPMGFEVVTPWAWRHGPAEALGAMAAWASTMPDEFMADDAVRDMCRSLEGALADARFRGDIRFPDTTAGEAALAVRYRMAAAWGAGLRERAFAPSPEGDDELAGFSP